MSKISIIVPVFDLESYVEKTAMSLLAQTYKDLEIIFVDDGSTDRSAEILDLFEKKDERIKVIHQANSGVTAARLRGVEAAAGEWIGFVDGDDWVEPDMYARLIDNAEKFKTDISHCGYQMVFHDRVDYYYNTGKTLCQSSKEALQYLLSGTFEPGLCNKLFHRSLFERLLGENLMDTSVRINEDLLMNFYLFRWADRSVFEDICPYHYLVRSGSAANSEIRSYGLADPLKVRRILLRETLGDAALHAICMRNYAGQLIRTASMRLADYAPEIQDVILESRKELKSLTAIDMKNAGFSKKLKGQVIAASRLPGVYRSIHHIYGEITGINQKYDLKRS